jgi:mevalonate kinase
VRSSISNLKISLPSKTFLLGEYAVLHGGTAIVLTHEPRFELKVSDSEEAACIGVSALSPAGQWLRRRSEKFQNLSIEFQDPYLGAGGFGASSAQFVGVYAISNCDMDRGILRPRQIDPLEAWTAYRSLNHGDGQVPSGSDVVAQILGGVTLFCSTPARAQSRLWPFADLSIVLAATGQKIATHEHLRSRLPVSDQIIEISEKARDAFLRTDVDSFCQAFKEFGIELERLQLATPHVRGLIAQISGEPGVVAAKGSGAMGADVLTVLCHKEAEGPISRRLVEMGLKPFTPFLGDAPGLRAELILAPQQKILDGDQDGASWV